MPGRMFWMDTIFDQDIAAGGSASQSLITGLTDVDTRLSQMTLMRTIVRMDIAPAVMDSGEGSVVVDCDIGIVTQVAFAFPTLPNPAAEGDFPVRGWVWRARWRVWVTAADRAVVVWRQVDVDLRSRRKLENGELFVIWENGPIE